MSTLRTILGVIAGDLIFAGSAVLLFYSSGVDPHAPAAPRFILLSIAYGVVFALIGGFVAGLVGGRADLITGMILALIIAAGAAVTLVSHPGEGSVWSQTAALVLMAPAALMGDWFRKTRKSSRKSR